MNKWLAWFAAAALCVAVGTATHVILLNLSKEKQPLLTYDTPVKVLTRVVTVGDEFVTEWTRCNNTSQELPVQVGIWLRDDSKHLVPFRFEHDGAMVGPRFDTKIAPGCLENYRSTYPLPPVPPGTYEVIGQICYGGTASLELPFTCSGWSSEKFEVRSR